MSNYPPGTSASDPRAPWNAPDPPECPECGMLVADADGHADGCEWSHMDGTDLVDAAEAAHGEMKFEERRLEERGL